MGGALEWVNLFSVEKHVFSEPMEIRHLIKALRELFSVHVSDTELFGDFESILSDILTIHYFLRQKNRRLEKKIATIVFENLTSKQKSILRKIAEMNGKSLTMTAMIGILSNKLDVAPSTIRWNLVALRETGLISAGNKDNKGIPVRLTEIGKLTALTLIEEQTISLTETDIALEVDA